MAGNSGRVIIPSPLQTRDFIHHEGEEYQIIRFLRTTNHTFEEPGLIYRVRNTRTNLVVNITLPLHVQPQQEEGEGEDDFFQILDVNEDTKEVTLNSFSAGLERRMKVGWEEDVELIKEGLKVEDKDLFCTLGRLLGKEMIGDFKFMAKDPPIMKMPDLVLDKIFSKLTPEDRLRCRLVTPSWKTLLPITKFLRCITLIIDPKKPTPFTAEFQFFHMWVWGSREVRVADVKARPFLNLHILINASLLQDVETLRIITSLRMDNHLKTVSQYCHKLTKLFFRDVSEDTAITDGNWEWGRRIILDNKQSLKHWVVVTPLRELDLSDIQIGDCTSLQHLTISLSRGHSILLNLECLPPSLTSLSIGCLAKPFTKVEVLFVQANLPQLTTLTLDAHHNHSSEFEDGGNHLMDEDEIDDDTILRIMNTPTIRRLTLHLGPAVLTRMDKGLPEEVK